MLQAFYWESRTVKTRKRLAAAILLLGTSCLGFRPSFDVIAAAVASSKTTEMVSNKSSNVVFRIGTFGRSALGFVDFGFAGPVPAQPVAVADDGQAEEGWYATQPAELQPGLKNATDGGAGAEPLPISFSVTAPLVWEPTVSDFQSILMKS